MMATSPWWVDAPDADTEQARFERARALVGDKTELAYLYTVDLDGFGLIGDITSVGAMSVEVPSADTWVVEWADTKKRPQPQLISKATATPQFSDITLSVKRVIGKNRFHAWLQAVVDGDWSNVYRNGTIRTYSADLDPTSPWWNFEGAWPSKWNFGTSGAGQSATKSESITLKINRLWVDQP